jgi:hypothetical protein
LKALSSKFKQSRRARLEAIAVDVRNAYLEAAELDASS